MGILFDLILKCVLSFIALALFLTVIYFGYMVIVSLITFEVLSAVGFCFAAWVTIFLGFAVVNFILDYF